VTKQTRIRKLVTVLGRILLVVVFIGLVAGALGFIFRDQLLRAAVKRYGTVEVTSFGLHTALIGYKKTCVGFVIEQRTKQTKMSQLIERCLGPQPRETEWGMIGVVGPQIAGDGAYGVVWNDAERLAHVVDSSMTAEAQKACLRDYTNALKDQRNTFLSSKYAEAVEEAVSRLGHPALPSDLPTLQSVRDSMMH